MPTHEHDAAAVAAAAAGIHPPTRQLLQAQFMLAPWIERHAREAASLPPPLALGPIDLLQRVLQLCDAPCASAKLLDDATILLLYGASYVQDHCDDDRTRSVGDVAAMTRMHAAQREEYVHKARAIQATWRTQRFHTNRLPALSLETRIQSDVAALMEHKRLAPSDSVENVTAVPVQVNERELEHQVVTYAEELRQRVEARRRDEDELQRKLLRDQKLQEEKRKRMIVQRKKRHENACRRWHYFTTRLLRTARDDDSGNARPTPQPLVTAIPEPPPSHVIPVPPDNAKKPMDRSKSFLHVTKNPVQRAFARRFVAKAVARGVSRVLCMYNMVDSDLQSTPPADLSLLPIEEPDTSATTTVIRLGLLLCDLHFGIKYTGLYQRFFDRAAKERGMRVEWHVFNCLKSQFPTKAHTRMLNGFLVAGGPNIGVITDESHGSDHYRRRSSGGARRNRHFGRWRQRLLTLLRELHDRKQTVLGGMGLGHVILAEALGARIGMREWEDGWCLLDPMIFFNESSTRSDRKLGQGMQGIKFLHGEFVQSFEKNGHGSARHSLKTWRSPGEHNFVACFRDTLTLSIDGSPECGTFVFETLGEFYDRDKAMRARQNTSTAAMGSLRKGADEMDGEDDDDDEEDYRPIVVDTAPSLAEKRRRLNVTDASERIADLFLDHFRRPIARTYGASPAMNLGGTMSIAGVVCSSNITQVDKSLRHLLGLDQVTGVFMNTTASADGHLMVTNPKAFAVIVDHDRRMRDQANKQRPANAFPLGRQGSLTSRPLMLTLSMMRDYERQLQVSSPSDISNPGTPRVVRLPSIRPESSTLSVPDAMPNSTAAETQRALVRRLSSSRMLHTSSNDGASVLTLSQALTVASISAFQQPAKSVPKLVFVRLLDEECKQTHDLLPLSKADLRTAWLRLTAAIRIAELRGEQIAIVSRHSLMLDYVKHKRPTWTFVKDCRRSEATHRKRLKKVAQYAAYADIVLFDQEFLLSNSATENDALIRKAKSFGLQVYVAPKDESPSGSQSTYKGSPTRFQKRKSMGSRSYRRLSKEISAKTSQGDSEYDMQVVEFMLLQFSGVDGVITSQPEAAIDAQERIAAKNEAMQEVEQLFRDWQAKDTAKAASPKRMSSTPQVDTTLDDEDPEDYVGDGGQYDSDESLPDGEVADEIARQRAEHSYIGSKAMTPSGNYNVRPIGSPAAVPLTAAPFVPLRPLQQKSGDDVFGAGAIRSRNMARSFVVSSSSGGDTGRVSSIGSFRAALKRTAGVARPFSPPNAATRDEGDARSDVRSAEEVSSRNSTRPLKPRSTRALLGLLR